MFHMLFLLLVHQRPNLIIGSSRNIVLFGFVQEDKEDTHTFFASVHMFGVINPRASSHSCVQQK